MCLVSPVTCHKSIMPTSTAMYLPPANSPQYAQQNAIADLDLSQKANSQTNVLLLLFCGMFLVVEFCCFTFMITVILFDLKLTLTLFRTFYSLNH